MSAVILQFPGTYREPPTNPAAERFASMSARSMGERLRVAREAIEARARSVDASAEQLLQARQAVLHELQQGSSLGGAIAEGYARLPRVRLFPRIRNPFRDPPEAA
jgi:hypothetical protein